MRTKNWKVTHGLTGKSNLIQLCPPNRINLSVLPSDFYVRIAILIDPLSVVYARDCVSVYSVSASFQPTGKFFTLV